MWQAPLLISPTKAISSSLESGSVTRFFRFRLGRVWVVPNRICFSEVFFPHVVFFLSIHHEVLDQSIRMFCGRVTQSGANGLQNHLVCLIILLPPHPLHSAPTRDMYHMVRNFLCVWLPQAYHTHLCSVCFFYHHRDSGL